MSDKRAWTVVPNDERALTIRSYQDGDDIAAAFVVHQGIASPECGGSFCGFNATQVWQDFYLWERLLNETPDITGIVELGTAYGGFSIYLETQARYRGLDFATFDSIDHRHEPIDRLFGRPPEHARPPTPPLPYFHRVELLKNGVAPEVLRRLSWGPVVLFCDNGHKVEEVKLYGPHLTPGSLCVVHDWKTEIWPTDIPDHWEERYGDFCDEIESMSRVFAVPAF